MKYSLEQIEQTLAERKIEQPKIVEIIKDLEQVALEEQEEKEANKLPTLKWNYLAFINDPEGKIKDEFDAFIVTYKDGVDAGTVLQKLRDGAKNQNEFTKKKKNKITNLGELFQVIKPKSLKEYGVKVKTKESVRVIPINGKLF